MNLIGIDFSIAKPAAVIYNNKNKKYNFYSWTKDITKEKEEIFKSAGVNIILRENKEVKDLTRYDIINADILSDMIIKDLMPYINKETKIAFEGSSYASKGNMIISIVAWRYILIYKLSKIIDINNIYTYAPITIKKTAGCSKKGTDKSDMIEAFINMPIEFSKYIKNNIDKFKTKHGNWITHLDDFADCFWILETLKEKDNL